MRRIGIMGGTFNPIHEGHVQIAKSAYSQYGLDEVWFMPNHIPAYKDKTGIASGADRLHMVELAIEHIPYFKPTDFELRRKGITYTWETLALLKEDYPEDSFFFIIGADSLFDFVHWKHPDRIVRMADILVAMRNQSTQEQLEETIQKLEMQYDCSCFHIIQCPMMDCSSSGIRKAIKAQYRESGLEQAYMLSNYLNKNVLEYINVKQLYI